MAGAKSLRAELDEVRAELARLREEHRGPEGQGGPPPHAEEGNQMAQHVSELNRLVQQMLEEAEETVAEHPVATVAGALALGIVIGRLTAR